ncbi:MAG: NADH-quinone oxidoreductase subunit D-related protein [Candidatus Kariarchaeaceae archaeon]
MTSTILNTDIGLSDVINLVNDGYTLLSIGYLGSIKETVQYSLINHEKSRIKHFTVDTAGKSLASLDDVYSNAGIFEFEVNQSHNRQIIDNSGSSQKWTLSPNFHSEKFRFSFSISDDIIRHVDISPGFSYRNIERNLINKELDTIPNVLAKICGFCSTGHTQAFCMLVENIMEIRKEISESVNLLRSLFAEIERIENHLLWIGLSTFSIGLTSIAMKALDLRNRFEQQLNKMKFAPSLNIIGGIYANLNEISKLSKSIVLLEKDLWALKEDKEFTQFLTYTTDKASLSSELALKYGSLGPLARSTGLFFDARVDFPYSGYRVVKYTPMSNSKGDLSSLFTIKWSEISASFELIKELLENISPSDIKPVDFKAVNSSDLTHSYVEAPNGLLQYTGKINKGKFENLHINVPTINNLVPTMARFIGTELQYIPLILRGIDMGYDPNDKLLFHDIQNKITKEITGFNLQKKSTKSLQGSKTLNFNDL